MTIAPADLPVPAVVRILAGDRTTTPVWHNGIGGTTWRLTTHSGAETYLKIGPPHPEFDVPAHIERLRWVGAYLDAPRVVDHGAIDGLLWFETAALPGWGAVSPHFAFDGPYAGREAELVAALGRALRHFPDSVPVADCRWTWSVEDRLAFRPLPRADVLAHHPPLDLVVCHGDACNPNFMFDDDLRCTGYVDLGQLGVGDRWADIAAATRSLGWNVGPGYGPVFLEAYGIEPDEAKLAYYQDLWAAEEESFEASHPAWTLNLPHLTTAPAPDGADHDAQS